MALDKVPARGSQLSLVVTDEEFPRSMSTLRLRDQDLEWREVHGEIVALDLRGSLYFTLNRTGAVLWPALSEGATREELVERLRSSYEVDEETAGRDVDAFLESLRERSLLA